MVYAINGFLVTAIVFGPAALAMLYAKALNKKSQQTIDADSNQISDILKAQNEVNAKILAEFEDLHEERELLAARIDKLEAKNKSGGRELLNRTLKLKDKLKKSEESGVWVERNRTIAPKKKEAKDEVYYRGAIPSPKKKARKQRSK